MKTLLYIFFFSAVSLAASAQSKTNTTKATSNPKPVVNSNINTFESDIVYGKLILTKSTHQVENKELVTTYKLLDRYDQTFNNRNPLMVTLTKQSFDNVFTNTTTDMAAKLPLLNKFIDENKLVLSEEKGWVAVVNYYNSLFQ